VKGDLHNVLIKPLLTEKVVSKSQEINTYAFEVAVGANKIEIRRAVEMAFKVKVLSVRTAMRHGGTRRFGYRRVPDAAVKRAYVTLAEGNRIDLL
jgi:large subunit ribosomal protein L23